MKKLLATLLATTLAFGAVALSMTENGITFGGSSIITASAEDLVNGDFNYKVLDDGTVEITDYNGDGKEVTIPDTIAGKKVTIIGGHAFYGCLNLTSITIPNSVTSISTYAFYRCSSLTSITIPNSVTSIGQCVFCSCKSLRKITIPDSVTSIGVSSFANCSSLTSITIPTSVTSIGKDAFYGCSSLTSITIPNSVTSIGDRAFYDCASLTRVTIPNSVTSIGNYAFGYRYDGLTNLQIKCDANTVGEKYAKDNKIDYIIVHSYASEITTQPTCTTTGVETFTCSCGHTYTKTIPAKEHDYSTDWTINKEATCITTGTKTRTCSVCGQKETQTIAKTAHKYNDLIVKSTYFTKGYTANQCSTCGIITGKKNTPLLVMNAPKASVTSNSIKLTWSRVKDAKGYDVYQYKNKKWTKIKTTTSTSLTLSKLPSGTTQNFKIQPYTKNGSKTVYGAFSEKLITSTKLAKVNFKITSSSKKATIKWNKVTGASGYKIYYKTTKNGSWKLIKTASSGTTSYTKTGLTNGKTYYFTVKAYKTVNNQTYSSSLTTKSVKIKEIKTKSVKLNKSKITIQKGNSYSLKSTINPSNSDEGVVWSSSNPSVASIKIQGKSCIVTGKKKGIAIITAKSGNKKVTCKVTVVEANITSSEARSEIYKLKDKISNYEYYIKKYQLAINSINIDKSSAQQSLNSAKSRLTNAYNNKVRVYTEAGGWVLETDMTAVKEAQSDVTFYSNIVSSYNNMIADYKNDISYYKRCISKCKKSIDFYNYYL